MTFDRPPDYILTALKEGLDSRSDLSDSLRKILTEDPTGNGVALKMYTVGLSHLAKGVCQQLDFKGWRFLASDANKDGVIIDVAAPTLGHPPRVTGVQRGPNAAKVIEDLQDVFSLREAQPPDADLSFVNMSGLMTEMIWIRQSCGAWLVPYHTLIRVLSKRTYTLAEFASVAGPLAKRRLDQDDSFELSQDAVDLSLEEIRPPAEKKKVPTEKVPKLKVPEKKVATKRIAKKK